VREFYFIYGCADFTDIAEKLHGGYGIMVITLLCGRRNTSPIPLKQLLTQRKNPTLEKNPFNGM